MAVTTQHANTANGNMAKPADPTKRIYLWTIPRSISTAFERCFIGLKNAHVVHEPYSTAYFFGPDSNNRSLAPFLPTENDYSYQKIKNRLESDYSGKDIIFCKDHAFTLNGRYDMLAAGFIHTILIRDPVKTMSSFHKLAQKPKLLSWPIQTILPDGLSYKELYDLDVHLRTKLGHNVAIIDAEDLLRYPEQMIRRYCDIVGIPFQSEMLDWDNSVNVTASWSRTLKLLQFLGGIYNTALSSTGFQVQKVEEKKVDLSTLPDEVLEAVKICQPYYDQLYQRRIIPEDRETEV